MAGAPRVYYRNYSSSDNTNVMEGKTGDIVLAPSALGFSPQLGYEFKEWNSNRSGTGATYPVGEVCIYDTLYAIWQEIDADVIITYQGNPIAAMDASGSKTLLTADNYCEDDIVVSYTKPSAPSPTLQAKTNVSPTTSSQTITADSGYDGLSSVQIDAISPVRTSSDLTASGATVSVPAGYYASAASKAVASGSATTPRTSFYASAQYYLDEWGSLTVYVNGSQAITPTVTAGYVSAGTEGIVSAYGTTSFDLSVDGYAFEGAVDDYEEEEGGGA